MTIEVIGTIGGALAIISIIVLLFWAMWRGEQISNASQKRRTELLVARVSDAVLEELEEEERKVYWGRLYPVRRFFYRPCKRAGLALREKSYTRFQRIPSE